MPPIVLERADHSTSFPRRRGKLQRAEPLKWDRKIHRQGTKLKASATRHERPRRFNAPDINWTPFSFDVSATTRLSYVYVLRTRQRESAQPESFNTLTQTSCDSLKNVLAFSFFAFLLSSCTKYRRLETSLYARFEGRSIGVTMLLDLWSYEGSNVCSDLCSRWRKSCASERADEIVEIILLYAEDSVWLNFREKREGVRLKNDIVNPSPRGNVNLHIYTVVWILYIGQRSLANSVPIDGANDSSSQCMLYVIVYGCTHACRCMQLSYILIGNSTAR